MALGVTPVEVIVNAFNYVAVLASALAPYWAGRLHKTTFFAFQASRRGGEIRCKWAGDRVELEGSCVFYMQGEAEI